MDHKWYNTFRSWRKKLDFAEKSLNLEAWALLPILISPGISSKANKIMAIIKRTCSGSKDARTTK